jgi:hypothetical protein
MNWIPVVKKKMNAWHQESRFFPGTYLFAVSRAKRFSFLIGFPCFQASA